jgi:hypothetical protein
MRAAATAAIFAGLVVLGASGSALAFVPSHETGPLSAQGSPGPDAATTQTTGSSPLRSTPPLGSTQYVFPVVGEVGYGDSYGVSRPDAPGGWHHGDDIFAALGAPVVAVADGTLGQVGWQRLGGWRLWLYNAAGDGFYYAHLSGYTAAALHSTYVKTGEVLGFIGDTGDADGGAPHLHFEVHPASLRYLGEDGAVNPTGYLQSWRRIQHVSAGRPVHPALPDGWAGQAAEQTFRELLAARPPIPRVARRLASLPASSGGIPPFLQRDLHPFGPPTVSSEADSPPFAVITGVIRVAAPAGVFHISIGWGALRRSAPALPEAF